MKRGALPTICWILVGILALSALIMSAGEQDSDSSPEVSSYSPSGIAALAALLQARKIPYVVNTEEQPEYRPGDIPVAFWLVDTDSKLSTFLRKQSSKCAEKIFDQVHKGGSALIIPLRQDFLEASRSTLKVPVAEVETSEGSKPLRVTDSGMTEDQPFDVMDDDTEESTEMTLWSQGKVPFLKAYRSGKGTMFVARDGIGMTNRFIDKQQNAEAFGRLFAMVAASGKRLVFTEASFGHVSQRGLLESIGPWANAAWQQLLLLGFVVAVTLGKRFGLPEESKTTQRGSRELLDAVADTYQRAGSTQNALLNAYRDADADLRIHLKLSKDAPRVDRDQKLPEALQKALARLEVASEMPNVTQDQALGLIKEAQKEMDAFFGPNRVRGRRLAKL